MQSSNANARYPKSVMCNFKKMSTESLIKMLAFYGVPAKKDSTQSELACIVARMFEARSIAEGEVVDVFASKYCLSTSEPIDRKRHYTREQLESEPAHPGEQVTTSSCLCDIVLFFFISR